MASFRRIRDHGAYRETPKGNMNAYTEEQGPICGPDACSGPVDGQVVHRDDIHPPGALCHPLGGNLPPRGVCRHAVQAWKPLPEPR